MGAAEPWASVEAAEPGQGPKSNSYPASLLSGWGGDTLPPLPVASRAAVTAGTLGKGLAGPEEGVAQREVGLWPTHLPVSWSPSPSRSWPFVQSRGRPGENGLSSGQESQPSHCLAVWFQASDLTFEGLGFLNWGTAIGMAAL